MKLSDLFYAWSHIFRRRSLDIPDIEVGGIDLRRLVNSELRRLIAYSSTFQGLLNYRFVRRLRDKRVTVKRAIDWFENQILDKGWNAGFHQFYPETPTFGYVGYPLRNHFISMFVTDAESKAAVIPKTIVVTGPGYVNDIRRYAPRQMVVTGPSMRAQWVWKDRVSSPDQEFFSILVVMPMSEVDACNILDMMCRIGERNTSRGLRFFIKCHPAMSYRILQHRYRFANNVNVEFVNGSIQEYIEKADLVVGNSSSVMLEAMTRGLQAIVIGNIRGLTSHPIPSGVEPARWRLCFTREELEQSILDFSKMKQPKISIDVSVRQRYFVPATEEQVTALLGLCSDSAKSDTV